MTRSVKVQIPAKVVFRDDEHVVDDLGLGKDVWVRRGARDYVSELPVRRRRSRVDALELLEGE